VSCGDDLLKEYPGFSVIDYGSYGVTALIISPQGNEMVLKIARLYDDGAGSNQETQIACLLNGMRKQTPVFGEVYGWQYCEGIPKKWKEILTSMPPVRILFKHNRWFKLIAMEHNGVSYGKMSPSAHERRQVLFLILHGLLVVRQTYPRFQHRDIHDSNILLKVRDPSVPITLELPVSKRMFEMTGVTYIPRLIDYGQSVIDSDISADVDLDDLRSFVFFEQNMEEHVFLSNIINHGKSLDEDTLLDPFFENVINVQSKRTKIGHLCQTCFSKSATIQHVSDSTRVFCGEACFYKANKFI
jgi:hypothetical protein